MAGNYFNRWLTVDIPEHPRIIKIEQRILNSAAEVILYTKECVDLGYEGAMVRSPIGVYKNGRCTFNETNIFKRKFFLDAEAEIISFVEQMTNLNPKKLNEMGLTSRSSAKSGKVGANTLGSFMLSSSEWPKPFNCGGGEFDHKERKEIWDNKERYLGKILTYKYQPHGSIDAPRAPIARRFKKEI